MLSDVIGSVTAVLIRRAGEAVSETDPRSPAGQLAEAAVVGHESADVDALTLGGKFAVLEMAAAIGPDQRLGERQQGVGPLAADIEREPGGVAAQGRHQKS